MGKKKKALLKYKRLGIISKKLEKKFANFLQANLDTFTTKVEETLEKIDTVLDKTEEIISEAKEEVVIDPEPTVEEKPKTTRKRKPATKKTATSTTRKRRTTKTKKEA